MIGIAVLVGLGLAGTGFCQAPQEPAPPPFQSSMHQVQQAPQPSSTDPNYKLVWSDEFTTEGAPDPLNWTFEQGFVRNEELQFYRPENAWCEGGKLIIEARRERIPNPGFRPGSTDWRANREFAEYTSACLITRGMHEWKYGRFEMRGRIDTRPGMWPAWWTLGTARRWPGCGEIDIMEYYRGILLANAAWQSEQPRKAAWDDLKKPITEFGDPVWGNRFHVWRMDWNADSIELYVDEVLLNSVDLNTTINGDSEKANPFREPHYMLLNLAIGGTSGGDPSSTRFPGRFEVDYVRVYEKVKR